MENQEVNIKLSVGQLTIVLQALHKMPFEQVVRVIGEIQSQANTQLKPQENVQ